VNGAEDEVEVEGEDITVVVDVAVTVTVVCSGRTSETGPEEGTPPLVALVDLCPSCGDVIPELRPHAAAAVASRATPHTTRTHRTTVTLFDDFSSGCCRNHRPEPLK